MKRPVKLGIATLKALGCTLVLGAAAHAAMPYLPLIGPPPIRTQVVKSPGAAVVTYQSLLSSMNTNLTASVTDSNSPAGISPFLPGTTNLIGPVSSSFVGGGMDESLGDTISSSVFTLPTPDLLGITPQTLATYFRPVQFGTNQPALFGPLHVNFMPPLPLPPTDTKSSHAEYIVK